MKAVILAAGLGTRLRPLTYICPKALLPVLNRPLLRVWLEQLEAAGFGQVAVNTHHLAEQVWDFLRREGPWGVNLQVSHEPEILGTGGGLRRLGEVLRGGPFLAVNADILTDLDLGQIFREHRTETLATLVLHDCPPYNKVWVRNGRVAGIGEKSPGGSAIPLAYTGIQVAGSGMLERLPPQGPGDLVATWRQVISAGERLDALVVKNCFWQDLGTPAAYLEAHGRLLRGEAPALARRFGELTDPLLGPGGVCGEGVTFGGGVCLGTGVKIGARAHLEQTVVWDGARIGPGVNLRRCVVGFRAEVAESAQDEVFT